MAATSPSQVQIHASEPLNHHCHLVHTVARLEMSSRSTYIYLACVVRNAIGLAHGIVVGCKAMQLCVDMLPNGGLAGGRLGAGDIRV